MAQPGHEEDVRWMQAALALARRAKGSTFPNPAVGAVVVARGRPVGAGMTAPAGGPHAEVRAIARAGRKAAGATLYVTLEPCCHQGRTGPCTEAILRAGIRRVVAAVRDPNPLVAGRGLAALRRAGVSVECGLCSDDARRLNEDFFRWVTRRAPWVSLKLAMTLDGRIADTDGASRWISSAASRRLVHQLRRTHAAVAVGRGTLVRDDPSLTVRHVAGPSPARVVFAAGAVPRSSRFVRTAAGARSIVVRPGGVAGRRRVRPDRVEVWETGTRDRVSMVRAFCRMAYAQGLPSVLVEGGQGMAESFLEAHVVNRLYVFYGPKVLGQGLEGLRFGSGLRVGRCIGLDRVEMRRLGDDLMVSGIVRYPGRK